MNSKITHSIIFLAAFILVTLAFVFGASAYRNIFKFDFTPVKHNTEPITMLDLRDVSKSSRKSIANLKKEILDSLKTLKDSSENSGGFRLGLADSSLVDSLKTLLKEYKKISVVQSETEKPGAAALPASSVKKDSSYQVWLKKSVKLYESMDTKKAAKIILSYSDNIARDLIFSMKQKTAAAVVAEFSPEIASRIMSVQK